LDKVIFLFWFVLPVGIANSMPVIAANIPALKKYDYPLDFYKKMNGKRILGSHKTIRGLIAGVIFAVLTVYLQKSYLLGHPDFAEKIAVDYSTFNPLIIGTLFGLGAVLGDATKSFFKRRIGIKPGGAWIPFDQIDFIVGGIAFSYFYVSLPLKDYLLIFVIYVVTHFLTNIVAYLTKMKDVPY